MNSPKYKLHTPEGTYVASCKTPELAVQIAELLGERATVKLGSRPIYRHITDGDASESIDLAVRALLEKEDAMHQRAFAKAYPASGAPSRATWKLKRTRQCAKCPWRVDVDPREIPDGYCETKHAALSSTITEPDDIGEALAVMSGRKPLHIMACHETGTAHCVGWLANQMGPGNNIALRISLRDCENLGKLKLVGEQHERFEDTLP